MSERDVLAIGQTKAPLKNDPHQVPISRDFRYGAGEYFQRSGSKHGSPLAGARVAQFQRVSIRTAGQTPARHSVGAGRRMRRTCWRCVRHRAGPFWFHCFLLPGIVHVQFFLLCAGLKCGTDAGKAQPFRSATLRTIHVFCFAEQQSLPCRPTYKQSSAVPLFGTTPLAILRRQ